MNEIQTLLQALLISLYGAAFLGAVGAIGFLFRKLSQVEAAVQALTHETADLSTRLEEAHRLGTFLQSLARGRFDDAAHGGGQDG